jgi:hypothetical protein
LQREWQLLLAEFGLKDLKKIKVYQPQAHQDVTLKKPLGILNESVVETESWKIDVLARLI